VVAGQERLDVVGAVRPAVADHAKIGCVLGVGVPPVLQQVVDHGEQLILGRVPRLEQVVVQADVVDRLDGDVGVGVRGEEEVLRARRVLAGPLEQLDAGHPGHPLVGRDQRDRLITQGELGQRGQRLGARRRLHHEVVVAVPPAQVASDRRRDHRVVVDAENRWFVHAAPPLL
jgi:hypothetical protein